MEIIIALILLVTNILLVKTVNFKIIRLIVPTILLVIIIISSIYITNDITQSVTSAPLYVHILSKCWSYMIALIASIIISIKTK